MRVQLLAIVLVIATAIAGPAPPPQSTGLWKTRDGTLLPHAYPRKAGLNFTVDEHKYGGGRGSTQPLGYGELNAGSTLTYGPFAVVLIGAAIVAFGL